MLLRIFIIAWSVDVYRASLVAQLVKNFPVMWETWVWSLGWEDSPEKETATHSSILAWRIPWTVQSVGLQRVGHDWATFNFTFKAFWLNLVDDLFLSILAMGSNQLKLFYVLFEWLYTCKDTTFKPCMYKTLNKPCAFLRKGLPVVCIVKQSKQQRLW